jgi:hypothetical protein
MAKVEILEQLELVDVQFEDNNQKAVLVFLHEDRGEIREVNFNRQAYDQDKKEFVPDEEKAKKVDEWCSEYFSLSFQQLGQAIGERKDVYCYDNFNSLWEVQLIEKFEEEMLGQIFETEVVNALDDGKKISIQFEYEGNLYESKMQYADYLETRSEWFINPQKRKKQYEKFEEKFLIPVENIAELIGKTIMVEVKKAYGKFIYSEVKPFKKPKKGAVS